MVEEEDGRTSPTALYIACPLRSGRATYSRTRPDLIDGSSSFRFVLLQYSFTRLHSFPADTSVQLPPYHLFIFGSDYAGAKRNEGPSVLLLLPRLRHRRRNKLTNIWCFVLAPKH